MNASGIGDRSASARFWRWVRLVVVLAELGIPATALAQSSHKQVLVLYSTRRDAEFSVVGEGELPRILDAGLGRDLDYYSEFLDVSRFPDPGYQVAFADFLRQKYIGVRFDLVVALQDVAVEFLHRNRDRLFPDTPEVFLANRPELGRGTNAAGLILERNFAGTVSFIQQLQPDVQNLFVVTGAAVSDKRYEALLRAQLRPFESRINVTYLAGLATDRLEGRVAQLPPRSAVYYVLVTEDGAGNKFHPLEYVERIAAAANAPTYSWVDSVIGRGVVGGNVYSQRRAVERIGDLALRVLRGEGADSIPVSRVDLNAGQADWRQLRRWRLSESRLPAGTVVSYREPGIWDRYKFYIIGAVALMLVQSGLIAGLLIQRIRRQRAEDELRASQSRLLRSYERIRDLGSRLLEAQETERSRIARELHDDISQQMALLTLDLQGLEDAGGGDIDKLAAEALGRARDISRSVHDLSHRLHPARLRLIGLVAALHALRLELSQSGTAITLVHDNVPAALPPDLMLCLFRVIQEALQNAIKYSQARDVSVNLMGGPDGLTLTVADNGVGFDVEEAWGKGLGLISMQERLEAIGGTLDVRSRPGEGTRLLIRIPAHVVQGVEPAGQSQPAPLSPRVSKYGTRRHAV
jgi:signal transduction histidine kinase